MEYSGIDGFLGTRASLMLDVVFLAMFAVLPVMGWSIYQAKFHARYLLHKRVQISLGIVLAIAVTAFEIDMRIHGWEDRAAGILGGSAPQMVWTTLYVHLLFAIPTPFVWAYVIVQAVRKFDNPPHPNQSSPAHIRWARIATVLMTMTSITGWGFYVVGFMLARG